LLGLLAKLCRTFEAMGNVTSSCANPSTHHCCRWTAEDDAELSVEGRTRKSKTEEEPRLNFDTNVIGPTNANIIGGGGAGASPLQELKFLEERSFKKDWQREPTPERTSKDTQNRKAQTAELKKAAKALQPKAAAKGGFPVSAKAKPKSADVSSVSMSSVSSSSVLPFSNPGKAPPQKEEKVVSPKTAEDRAVPAAKPKAVLPEEPEKPVEGTEQSTVPAITAPASPASPNPCKKLIPSLSPALWSPMHRRWTCQKALQAEPAQPAQTSQTLQPAATAITVDQAETDAQVEEKPQRVPPVLSLCSPPPALWSPLHRKWCGAVLKMQLAQVPTLLVKKAVQGAGQAKALQMESEAGLEKAQSELLETVKMQVHPPCEALKAQPPCAPASLPRLPARISFSSAPALYSKWHGRWTGCLPEPAKLGA